MSQKFAVFDRVTMPHAEDLRAALADFKPRPDRDRTPNEWLYGLCVEHPRGLVALHLAYAQYLAEQIACGFSEDLDFQNWSWLLAQRIFFDVPVGRA